MATPVVLTGATEWLARPVAFTLIRNGAHISHHCQMADHVFVAADVVMVSACQVGAQAISLVTGRSGDSAALWGSDACGMRGAPKLLCWKEHLWGAPAGQG